jgi:hypothetical protein
MADKRALLSTLWIFVVFNYLYCDIVSLMDSTLLKQYLTGVIRGTELTHTFLLLAGILMEIPIAMILLSRLLPHRLNRYANIAAAIIMTGVQAATVFVATTTYYLFFSAIEITCTLAIFLIALRWTGTRLQVADVKA